MTDLKFEDVTGKTAFLEGGGGLANFEKDLYDFLESNGKEVVLIDSLYEQPSRIKGIVGCENLCFFTTGVYKPFLTRIIAEFEKLNYQPARVFFVHKIAATFFPDQIERLSQQGTKFYVADHNEKLFYELTKPYCYL